jgi:hypothetical protein
MGYNKIVVRGEENSPPTKNRVATNAKPKGDGGQAMNKSEFLDCLIWLQSRMDEYDDKEAYQDDYKIVSMIWSFMRGRIPEED